MKSIHVCCKNAENKLFAQFINRTDCTSCKNNYKQIVYVINYNIRLLLMKLSYFFNGNFTGRILVGSNTKKSFLYMLNHYIYIYIYFLHQILHIDIYTVIIVLHTQRRDYVTINVIWKIGVTNNYRIVHGRHLYSSISFDEPTASVKRIEHFNGSFREVVSIGNPNKCDLELRICLSVEITITIAK